MTISQANINQMVYLKLNGRAEEAIEVLDNCILQPRLYIKIHRILASFGSTSAQDLDKVRKLAIKAIHSALPKEEKPDMAKYMANALITKGPIGATLLIQIAKPAVTSQTTEDFTGMLLGCREIFFKIISFLKPKDLNSAMFVSQRWCQECVGYVNHNEVVAASKYTQLLASNLDEHCSEKKQELLGLCKSMDLYFNFEATSLSDIQTCLKLARSRVYEIIQSLKEGDALLLEERLASAVCPSSCKGLLDCAGIDNEIESEQDTYIEVVSICNRLLNIGDFDRAIAVVDKLPQIPEAASYRDMAYDSICRELVRNNEVKRAKGLAVEISDPKRKSNAYCMIALAFLKMGKLEEAREVYDQMPIIENTDIIDDKLDVCKGLCGALINIGKIEEALELFNKLNAEKIYDSSKKEIRKSISIMLYDRAKILLQNNELGEAIMISSLIPRNNERSNAFRDLANKFFAMGQLIRAVEMASKCDSVTRNETLRPILKAFMKNLTSKEKEEAAKEVIAMIDACTNEKSKNSVRLFLANAFAANGEFSTAEELADQITHLSKKDQALIPIYKNMLDCGKIEYAIDVIVKLAAPGSKNQMYAVLKMILVGLDFGKNESIGLLNLFESRNFNPQAVANYMKACLEKPPLSSSTSS